MGDFLVVRVMKSFVFNISIQCGEQKCSFIEISPVATVIMKLCVHARLVTDYVLRAGDGPSQREKEFPADSPMNAEISSELHRDGWHIDFMALTK